MNIVYLTYFEPMSGVYEGQVLDVCQYLEATFSVPVTLVAVLSSRDFRNQQDRLLARRPTAKALRCLPGWRAWLVVRRMVSSQIAAALPPGTKAILARGPIAASLAVGLRERDVIARVGYDGRGAVAAEWREYAVAPTPAWQVRMPDLERTAVLDTDIRISVSNALVQYWQEVYGYTGTDHSVIPCTLSEHHQPKLPSPSELTDRRRELGFTSDQIVICYSGSAAEWQSITALDPWLHQLMTENSRVVLLMMTRADLSESAIVEKHGDRVVQTWVSPDRVKWSMEACDYGLLLRSESVTNRVAAPTKFAEYLAAGLYVLISPGVGDYSELVHAEAVGEVCDLLSKPPIVKLQTREDRAKRNQFAFDTFSKSAFAGEYRNVLAGLGKPT